MRNFKVHSLLPLISMVSVISAVNAAEYGSPSGRTSALEEVVVVAQKKEESLQDAPISIQAFGSESLEKLGITDVLELGPQVPNVHMISHIGSTGTPMIFIRGVGMNDVQVTQDSPIGIYLNGVYIARATGQAMDLADIQSMEILRGPQGTLFGRNAVGGALNVITVPADPDAFALKQKVSAGNRGLFSSQTRVNIPLSDDMAVKLAYMSRRKDGYLENEGPGLDFYDEQSEAGRIDLRWNASDSLTVDYSYDFSRAETGFAPFQATNAPRPQDGPWGAESVVAPNGATGPASSTVLSDIINISSGRVDSMTTDFPLLPSDNDIEGHALTFAWELGSASFKSITAYRELEMKTYADMTASNDAGKLFIGFGAPIDLVSALDFLPEPFGPLNAVLGAGVSSIALDDYRHKLDGDQFSQEFQLQGNYGERIEYLVGLYYFKEHAKKIVPPGAAAIIQLSPSVTVGALQYEEHSVENSAEAVYGRVTYTPDAFEDRLRLTLGMRYTEDHRKASSTRIRQAFTSLGDLVGNTLTIVPGTVAVNFIDAPADKDFDNFSYDVTVGYDFSDTVYGYAKVATAYKAGGFNIRSFRPGGPTDTETVGIPFADGADEETVLSYELGLKGEFFDRRLRVNTAVFYAEYDDIQLNALMDPRQKPFGIITIGDTDFFNGGVAEISGLELDITAVLAEGLIASVSYGYTAADFVEINDPRATPVEQLVFLGTPENSYTVNLDYEFEPFSFGTLSANINYSFTDETYFSSDTVDDKHKRTISEDYALVNARLTLSEIDAAGGVLNIALWGKNLADEEYVNTAIAIVPIASRTVLWGEPRSYGLDISYEF